MKQEVLKYAIELDKTRRSLEEKMLFIGMNRERGLEIRVAGSNKGYRMSDEEAKLLQDNISNKIDEILDKIKEL